MKCHDCVKHLTIVNVHAHEIHKAVVDYKRARNEVNIFKVDHHIGELRATLEKIDKHLAEKIINESKEVV